MVARSSAKPSARNTPAGYPHRLETRIGKFAVRPIVPTDAGRLREEFRSADAETLRLRFFVAAPHLSEDDFVRLATVDYSRRLALTVWDGKRPIAIGRYEPTGPTTAEVAFVVKAGFRNRGIGRQLLDILADEAFANGYDELEAIYLSENAAAAASLANAGFVAVAEEDGLITARRHLVG